MSEQLYDETIAKITDISPSTVSSVLKLLPYERMEKTKTLAKSIMMDEGKIVKDYKLLK